MDVDGVLITCEKHWSVDLEAVFDFDVHALQTHFFKPYWADIVTGRDMLLPRLADALRAIGSAVKAADLRDYWFENDSMLNQPLLAWVAAHRSAGHRVMLATNQDRSRANYLMTHLGLSMHCDGIYASGHIGLAKPDPGFFAHIENAEARRPSDLFLIDDSPKNIAAARAAGWQGHLYDGPLPSLQ